MWWLLGLVVGGALILSEEAKQSRRRWAERYREVERTVEEHRANIEAHLVDAQASCNFHLLRNVYVSSFKVADEAYKLLTDARESLNGIGQALIDAKTRINELKEKRESKELSPEERVNIQKEIDDLFELRKALFPDKDKVKQERDHLLEEVKKLNQQTHNLKEAIRDRCGYGGRLWYAKLERRKARRQLA